MISTLVLIYLGRPWLEHTIKTNSLHYRLLIQRYPQCWFFIKGSGRSLSTTFCVWFFKKNIPRIKPLIHGQINLIKFIESNKFDNVYSKIWRTFVWSNYFDQILKKIGRVLFHQINLMKKSQSKLKSPRVKKKLQK